MATATLLSGDLQYKSSGHDGLPIFSHVTAVLEAPPALFKSAPATGGAPPSGLRLKLYETSSDLPKLTIELSLPGFDTTTTTSAAAIFVDYRQPTLLRLLTPTKTYEFIAETPSVSLQWARTISNALSKAYGCHTANLTQAMENTTVSASGQAGNAALMGKLMRNLQPAMTSTPRRVSIRPTEEEGTPSDAGVVTGSFTATNSSNEADDLQTHSSSYYESDDRINLKENTLSNGDSNNDNDNTVSKMSYSFVDEASSLAKSELQRLQQIVSRQQSSLVGMAGQVSTSSTDEARWRLAYVQSVMSAVTLVASEQPHSSEHLELMLINRDQHVANILALLEDSRRRYGGQDLPSLEQLMSPDSYIDEFGFLFKFTDSSSTELIQCVAGALLDHFYSQTNQYRDNIVFWKMLIDRNDDLHLLKISSTVEASLYQRYIPNRLRPDIWRLFLQRDVANARSKQRPDYYSTLALSAGSLNEMEDTRSELWNSSSMPASESSRPYYNQQQHHWAVVRRQIVVDVRRTLPNNIRFQRNGCGVVQLYRVLAAFAKHKPKLGYCQGLNFIAAILLLFMEEEDAFWSLIVLTEKYFADRHFDGRLTGVRADQELCLSLMRKFLPNLSAHLEVTGCDLSSCFIPWLMSGFYDAVPFQTLLRIWDCFLIGGYTIFYRVAIALLKLQERSLLTINDPVLILKHMKLFPKLCHDSAYLLQVAFEELGSQSLSSTAKKETASPGVPSTWTSKDDLLSQRQNQIRQIEKADISAMQQHRKRSTMSTRPIASLSDDSASMLAQLPIIVTLVEPSRFRDQRLFVWIDDTADSTSICYASEALGFDNFTPKSKPASIVKGQLVLTFTQFRSNYALISTAGPTSGPSGLSVIELATGSVVYRLATGSLVGANDQFACAAYDDACDAIFMLTQAGTLLVVSCARLLELMDPLGKSASSSPPTRQSQSSRMSVSEAITAKNVNNQLTTAMFRLLVADCVSCCGLLVNPTAGTRRLLVGSGSFIYQLDTFSCIPRQKAGPVGGSDSSSEEADNELTALKIHVPSHDSPSTFSGDSMDKDTGASPVSQIVPSLDGTGMWVLCASSPVIRLFIVERLSSILLLTINTLAIQRHSFPSCLLVSPAPSHLDTTASDAHNTSNDPSWFGGEDVDDLFIGFANGCIAHLRLASATLTRTAQQSPKSSPNESSVNTTGLVGNPQRATVSQVLLPSSLSVSILGQSVASRDEQAAEGSKFLASVRNALTLKALSGMLSSSSAGNESRKASVTSLGGQIQQGLTSPSPVIPSSLPRKKAPILGKRLSSPTCTAAPMLSSEIGAGEPLLTTAASLPFLGDASESLTVASPITKESPPRNLNTSSSVFDRYCRLISVQPVFQANVTESCAVQSIVCAPNGSMIMAFPGEWSQILSASSIAADQTGDQDKKSSPSKIATRVAVFMAKPSTDSAAEIAYSWDVVTSE